MLKIHYKAESTGQWTACGRHYYCIDSYSVFDKYLVIGKEKRVTLDRAKVTCKSCLWSLDFRESSRLEGMEEKV